MRLAHFSDFHLKNTKAEFRRSLALVDLAIEDGAEHLVISGDLVDSQQTKVVQAFMVELEGRGYGTADELSVVPGNHDVFVGVGLPRGRPTAVFHAFNEATESCRTGESSVELVEGCPYPYGKMLSSSVVLVGLDTTRNGQFNPRQWAAGELPKGQISAAKAFFEQHSKAAHKIVVMHHYPYKRRFVGGFFEQNFVKPDPATVRRWLRGSGATLVLCGHIHVDPRENDISSSCHLIRTGISGGADAEKASDGTTPRGYALIELGSRGKVRAKHRIVTGNELDVKTNSHEAEADWLDK